MAIKNSSQAALGALTRGSLGRIKIKMQGLLQRKMFRFVLTGLGVLAMTGVASATALSLSSLNPGVLNGGNLSVLVDAGSGACINFYNTTPIGACLTTANFSVNSPSDTIFGAVGTLGTTNDFKASQQTGTTPPSSPYTGGVGFITVNGITFDMTNILIPNAIACPPSSAPGVCSFGDFIFTQQDFNGTGCVGGITPCGNVNVSFGALGIAYTGTSSSGYTPYVFSWSAQFNNETTNDLIARAQNGGVTDSVSFTATPQAVPEPAAFLLSGLGLLAVGLFGRRRAARS